MKKLTNCRSEQYLGSNNLSSSPQDSMVEDSEICQLLQKLRDLQQRQERSKELYLSKIQQLHHILSQQTKTEVSLEAYIVELRKENAKQQQCLSNLKEQLLMEIASRKKSKIEQNFKHFRESCKDQAPTSKKRLFLGGARSNRGKDEGLPMIRSVNMKSVERRSASSSRSKLNLFKSSETMFTKSSQNLRKTFSNRDLKKIQSEYFEQENMGNISNPRFL